MRDRCMVYRPWERDNKKVKKGFVANLNSKTLNERRKEVKSVKRQQGAIFNHNGKKKRVRGKLVDFDPKKHVVVDLSNEENEKKDLSMPLKKK